MMGFDEADSRVIVTLVRHHLLLADTATRRDLEDAAVISHVAGILGDVSTLDLLHELTIADSLATGPTVCTDWRFGLINDLVDRVRATMAGRPLPEPPELTEHQEVALAQAGVWVLMDVRDATCVVTVGAADRLGLLALVAGVLSLNRLNVLAARVMTVGERAVQEWTVRPAFGDPPSVEQLSDDIRRAIDGTYDVAGRLAKRDAEYSRTPRSEHPRPVVAMAGAGVDDGRRGARARRAGAAPPGRQRGRGGGCHDRRREGVDARLGRRGRVLRDGCGGQPPRGRPSPRPRGDPARVVRLT